MPFYGTFVRHGESTGNLANLMQCSTGGELTDRGKEMSRALGRCLSQEKFSHVFSSDLNRCVQTTRIILEELKTKPAHITYTPVLRERDYGDWEMKPVDYPPIVRKVAEMKLEPHTYHRIEGPPNAETYEATKARAAKFFTEEILKLVDEHQGESNNNALVVCHGIYLMCFLDYLIQSDLYELKNFNPEQQLRTEPANCSRTRFYITKTREFPGQNSSGKRQIAFTHFFDTTHLNDMIMNT